MTVAWKKGGKWNKRNKILLTAIIKRLHIFFSARSPIAFTKVSFSHGDFKHHCSLTVLPRFSSVRCGWVGGTCQEKKIFNFLGGFIFSLLMLRLFLQLFCCKYLWLHMEQQMLKGRDSRKDFIFSNYPATCCHTVGVLSASILHTTLSFHTLQTCQFG